MSAGVVAALGVDVLPAEVLAGAAVVPELLELLPQPARRAPAARAAASQADSRTFIGPPVGRKRA
ncbi:MAG TPA: hypothetical protein VN772_05575 [Solirubrobacteraceae bacterium]|nr:hypothetical protein [Solirubrobacteraceae bacterium]